MAGTRDKLPKAVQKHLEKEHPELLEELNELKASVGGFLERVTKEVEDGTRRVKEAGGGTKARPRARKKRATSR